VGVYTLINISALESGWCFYKAAERSDMSSSSRREFFLHVFGRLATSKPLGDDDYVHCNGVDMRSNSESGHEFKGGSTPRSADPISKLQFDSRNDQHCALIVPNLYSTFT
jgi:hypothetical protein